MGAFLIFQQNKCAPQAAYARPYVVLLAEFLPFFLKMPCIIHGPDGNIMRHAHLFCQMLAELGAVSLAVAGDDKVLRRGGGFFFRQQ